MSPNRRLSPLWLRLWFSAANRPEREYVYSAWRRLSDAATTTDGGRCSMVTRLLAAVRGAALMIVLSGLPPAPAPCLQAQARPGPALDARVHEFIASVDTLEPAGIVRFFPTTGDVKYRRTIHTAEGTQTGVWRFPAPEVPVALSSDGPLWASFEIQPEAQPVGLFEHQVKLRPGRWRRVRGTRFVPPGADALSPIYVEWRQEGTKWVIAEFGDELFTPSARLPAWCC